MISDYVLSHRSQFTFYLKPYTSYLFEICISGWNPPRGELPEMASGLVEMI